MRNPYGIDDIEDRCSYGSDHLPTGFTKPGVMPKTTLVIGHRKQSIKMFERCSNLGTPCVVMLKYRYIDQLQILAVTTDIPDTFTHFNAVPATTGETGIGNVLIYPVAVSVMIIWADHCLSYGIKEIV